MALINRVSRLFKADVHAVLDRMEEPEALLRQSVREMEEVIEQDEHRLSLLENELRQATSRQQGLQQALAEIETQMDVCFESDKQDLAKKLVRRKLELQQQEKVIAGRHAENERAMSRLRALIDERRQTLQSMQQKVSLLVADSPSDDGYGAANEAAPAIAEHDVEVAFLQEKKRRAQL